MNQMRSAFEHKTIKSGWHYDGRMPDGKYKYRGPDKWIAIPISVGKKKMFIGWAVFDGSNKHVDTVHQLSELP